MHNHLKERSWGVMDLPSLRTEKNAFLSRTGRGVAKPKIIYPHLTMIGYRDLLAIIKKI